MDKYFRNFPQIQYNNKNVTDITRRVKISEIARKNSIVFYPLTIESSLRADHVAEAYYEDPEVDWLIYLTNDIIDPYYGWYLNEQEFNNFIVKKYGSQEAAIESIWMYRTNWAADDEELTPNYFDNILPNALKKYYSPNYGVGNKIISYSRKQENWTAATNRILKFTTSSGNSSVFVNGEIIDIKYSGEIVGGGTVVFSNSSTLTIQHVTGNTSANGTHTKTIIGETSAANIVANAVTTVAEFITNSESNYWQSVSYFDYEFERNEAKKHLQILDSGLLLDVSEQLRQELKDK